MIDTSNARKKLLGHFGKPVSGDDFWSETPLSTKDDLRKIGLPAEFAEMRVTSGSTGEPLYVFYSKEAVESFTKRGIATMEAIGVGKNDVLLNLYSYGSVGAGINIERVCNRMNIPILPFGAPNTCPAEKVIDAIARTRPTAWVSVPSYALRLLSMLETTCPGYAPKKIFAGGEELLDRQIELFGGRGIEVYDAFGMTECRRVGISRKEEPKVFDVISQGLYVETENTENGTELILTDLNNFSTPIIRYRTNDIVKNVKYDPDGSVTAFEFGGRATDHIDIGGSIVSKSSMANDMLAYSNEFLFYIKTGEDMADAVDIVLPESCITRENDILSSLSYIHAKISLVFAKKVNTFSIDSNKSTYVIDLRNCKTNRSAS
ncbi:2-succinylbenzoate--CoA ligase [uncultured archaeon]|nr:2-succinylbenzoate--CoA ligase [uncultured archaeon]